MLNYSYIEEELSYKERETNGLHYNRNKYDTLPVVSAGVHSCSPVAPHSSARDALLVAGAAPDALIMRLRLIMLPASYRPIEAVGESHAWNQRVAIFMSFLWQRGKAQL